MFVTEVEHRQQGLEVERDGRSGQLSRVNDCRYGSSCWLPLCPNVPACGRARARMWAEMWALLAAVEDEEPVQAEAAEGGAVAEENCRDLGTIHEALGLDVDETMHGHFQAEGVTEAARVAEGQCRDPGTVQEEIIEVFASERKSDVLRIAFIERVLDGVEYYECVQDIEQVKESGERLYLVKYTDGDVEHLTADQVVMYGVRTCDSWKMLEHSKRLMCAALECMDRSLYTVGFLVVKCVENHHHQLLVAVVHLLHLRRHHHHHLAQAILVQALARAPLAQGSSLPPVHMSRNGRRGGRLPCARACAQCLQCRHSSSARTGFSLHCWIS